MICVNYWLMLRSFISQLLSASTLVSASFHKTVKLKEIAVIVVSVSI